jgi:hypothetical protein
MPSPPKERVASNQVRFDRVFPSEFDHGRIQRWKWAAYAPGRRPDFFLINDKLIIGLPR